MVKHLALWLVGLIALYGCTSKNSGGNDYSIRLEGRTMGTTFEVVYIDTQQRVYDSAIDSLLVAVNNSMSTYIPNSTISTFNASQDTAFFPVDEHFYIVYLRSKALYNLTHGAFNPAVMPLVRYWGFGPEEGPEKVEERVVDSLLALTDFRAFEGTKVMVDGTTRYLLKKSDPRLQLDFSAIAKGYGVDVLHDFLQSKGLQDIFVEIGGEIRVSGQAAPELPWVVGIEDPVNSTLENRKALAYVTLAKGGIATSGNYRNVREIDGVKYTHTIDPSTGYSVRSNTLSASIVAEDCMTADALATACMVASLDSALSYLAAAQVEGLLMYSNANGAIDTVQTKGFARLIRE